MMHGSMNIKVVRSLCVIYFWCVISTGAWRVYVILRYTYAVPARSVVGNSQDKFLMCLFRHVERFLTTYYTAHGEKTNRRHVLNRN